MSQQVSCIKCSGETLSRALHVVRSYYKPLMTWYGLSVFFELWTEAAEAARGVGGAGAWGLPLVEILSLLLALFCYIGFYGAAILAAGKSLGLAQGYDFGPSMWIKDLTLEGLKAFLYSLPWMLLFVVPGVVRLIRYSFVPTVVLLEPEYRLNQVDALKTSKAFSEGIFGKLCGLALLVVLADLLTIEYSVSSSQVGLFALSRLVDFFVNIFVAVSLCDFYLQQKKKRS